MSTPSKHAPANPHSETHLSPIESIDGMTPVIGDEVFIHRTAAVIGRVELGDRVNLWPQVTLRGDEGMIKIGEDSNIQDGTTIHMTGGYSETMIGARVTVGHMCLLHGCKIGDDCLIGMGTMLLDNCVIGEGCYIAAGTMITGNKKIPPQSFVMGRPGQLVIKPITDIRRQEREYSWRHYVELAAKYLSPQGIAMVVSLSLIGLSGGLTACSSLDAQPSASVVFNTPMVKQHHVTIATLKRLQLFDYTPFSRTEYDPFSHQREVLAITGDAPIMINYRTFSSPKVDYVIERAQSLYAQYRFAQATVQRFKTTLVNGYGEEVFDKEIDELQSLLNDPEATDSLPPNVIAGARATRLSIAGHQDLVERARATRSQLNGWRQLLASDQLNNTNLTHYEEEMIAEIASAREALNAVMSGAPLLSKSMREVAGVAAVIR